MRRAGLLLLLGAGMALFSSVVRGQGFEKGDYVTTTTHTIIVPEGGTLEEALRLSSEWGERVLKQYPGMRNVRYLLSAAEADTMQLLVIYEYDSKTAADTAGSAIRRLIESEWPEMDDRKAFFDSLATYINPAMNIRGEYWEILTHPE